MKIATFNVNSVRARLPIVTTWLKANRPDVLAMQETKVQDESFPTAAFEEIGYACAFRGQKSYNGVAFVARHEIRDVAFGLADEPRDETRLIAASIQGITLVNTYVPQGYLPTSERFQYKLDWFRRLLEYFQANYEPTDPILWMGDFNVAPLPIDVYDPESLLGHVCYHPAVHEALERIMQWGFTDVFRLHCQEAGQYTFWDYRPGNAVRHNRGWRLDHVMATGPLAARSVGCTIDKRPRTSERPSDHTPVVVELDG